MTRSLIPDVDLVPSVASRVVRVRAADMQEGKWAAGATITFGLPYALRVPADGVFIKPGSKTVTLSSNGIADIRLPCYDPDALRVDGGRDWLIVVNPSWGKEYGIRVPVGTTRINLAALEPVRELTAREKQWAITGVSVTVTPGGPAAGTGRLVGGILDLDLSIPEIGEDELGTRAISLDTDGTPYWDEGSGTHYLLIDADGAPYFRRQLSYQVTPDSGGTPELS